MKTSVHLQRELPAASISGYGTTWAALGVVATLFSCVIFAMWAVSDQFAAVPVLGEDVAPASTIFRIRLLEAISMAVAIGGLVWFLVLPWVRQGRPSIEGLLLIGALISYVFDTTINLTQYVMAWNNHAFNYGTWGDFFPGHSGPTEYSEALFWGPPMYVYFGVVLAALQLASLRFLQSRLKLGFCSAVAGAFVVAFVFDLVVESQIIKLTEAYSWCFTIGSLTLWAGEQHQFPLYEPFLVALYSTLYLWLILSRENDPNGVSFIERGLERLPAGWHTPARLMAATGFATLTTIMYFAGFYLFTLFADTYAQLPSYLLPPEYIGAWPPL
ncbi:MAG: spirocyclase AveC family protein [Pseudomonadaceae bacterium]